MLASSDTWCDDAPFTWWWPSESVDGASSGIRHCQHLVPKWTPSARGLASFLPNWIGNASSVQVSASDGSCVFRERSRSVELTVVNHKCLPVRVGAKNGQAQRVHWSVFLSDLPRSFLVKCSAWSHNSKSVRTLYFAVGLVLMFLFRQVKIKLHVLQKMDWQRCVT